jgi:NADPH2:quinone reductase
VALKARGVSYVDVCSLLPHQVQRDQALSGSGAAGVMQTGADDQCSLATKLVSRFAEEAVSARSDPARGGKLETAAAFRSNHTTAYYALQRGRLKAGEVLLVHGAAGGVGLATVDMGKLFGATVIATASTAEKLAVCKKMGADHVINYTHGFRDQIRDLTHGRGADVILDPVGGDVFDESMRCIAPFGRLLIVGFTSGRPALAKTNHLLIKDAEAIGFTIGALSRHDPAWAQRTTIVGARRRITPMSTSLTAGTGCRGAADP